MPVIAVINATVATMPPVTAAFGDEFPGAEVWHLLDDRLMTDAERLGGLTPGLRVRMESLIGYAVSAGADAVQLACSMYGPVVADAEHPVPVRAADQALFDEIERRRPDHVTILSSFRPAATDSAARLRDALAGSGQAPAVDTIVVEAARRAAEDGDPGLQGTLLAEAVRGLDRTDLVALAQYSLAPVAAQVAAAVPVLVLSGPHLAAAELARTLRAVRR